MLVHDMLNLSLSTHAYFIDEVLLSISATRQLQRNERLCGLKNPDFRLAHIYTEFGYHVRLLKMSLRHV